MTDVQICNLALARLGDARIDTLADATAQAQYCTLFYTQTVAELQAEFDWQFCRKQVSLTSGTTPLGGYTFQYALPADYIRSFRLANIDESENFGQWEILGAYLQTNFASPVTLDYIANITDTTKFPAIFTELLAVKLAGVLAMPLTGSKDLFKQCVELYMAMLGKPAFANATEKTQAARTTTGTLTSTEICRQAILRVGSANLFEPFGEPMALAQSFYEVTRDELLSDFQWSFTRSQISISKDAANPSTGYAYRYAIPAGTGQIIRLNNIDDADNTAKWEVVGGYIHTDLPTPITLDYTSKITDPAKFPPIFVHILTVTLAIKLNSIVERNSAPSK